MSDILDQIDTAVTDWEARPESWLPGDPLYAHPNLRNDINAQTVRPMIDLLPADPWWRARCEPCQVSWDGIDPCFVCGEERPPVGIRDLESWTFMIDALEASRRFNLVSREVAELLERQASTALDRLFVADPPPPVVPDLQLDTANYRQRVAAAAEAVTHALGRRNRRGRR